MTDRFSKPNLFAALERRAEALQKEFGFDRNNGTAQLKGKLASQDAAVDYGKFRLFHDLLQQTDRVSKPTLLAALERRAEALQKEFGFDVNNGTAQLKGKLAGQDAAVAYGKFRLCHEMIQQIDDGSLLRL
ncbi:hypothetical protein F6X40_09320 [Paraburkholderia sp. UCT31]|uniref:hypothetical protein n=1 Tax=Paraburkholderia sp. UCT31 TaxID=2615209 RepID=UPI0016564B71|nr:hypothetical protein [Paraburkholderia sp. UCT31]MBC8737007.1 hypothetical protein [Paraburkholderia sp. UCT31]